MQDHCRSCQGAGVVKGNREVRVEIPAGKSFMQVFFVLPHLNCSCNTQFSILKTVRLSHESGPVNSAVYIGGYIQALIFVPVGDLIRISGSKAFFTLAICFLLLFFHRNYV